MAGQRQEAGFTGIGLFRGFARIDDFLFSVSAALDFFAKFRVNRVYLFAAFLNAVFQVNIGLFQCLLNFDVRGDVVKRGNKAAPGQRIADHFDDFAIAALTQKSMGCAVS